MTADDLAINAELTGAKQRLWSDFDDLEPDNYLKDGARFRLRHFANVYFRPNIQEIRPLPHQAYFQDKSINEYAGGIQRNLAPLNYLYP
jgi:hypothetical protein